MGGGKEFAPKETSPHIKNTKTKKGWNARLFPLQSAVYYGEGYC